MDDDEFGLSQRLFDGGNLSSPPCKHIDEEWVEVAYSFASFLCIPPIHPQLCCREKQSGQPHFRVNFFFLWCGMFRRGARGSIQWWCQETREDLECLSLSRLRSIAQSAFLSCLLLVDDISWRRRERKKWRERERVYLQATFSISSILYSVSLIDHEFDIVSD